jgi:type II secretory pathway component GspD/PulD (secretin)
MRQRPELGRTRITLFAVLALFVVAPAVGAADAASPAVLENRIDLDLKDALAKEVLSMFAQVLGAEIELDPAIEGKVTITLHNVTARTALTAVCEGLGCKWRFLPAEPARLIVEPQAQPRGPDPGTAASLTLQLDRVTARDAFEAVARVRGLHIVLEPGVEGKVSVSLTDRKMSEVLDELCRQIDCRWEVTVGSDGTTLRVEPR